MTRIFGALVLILAYSTSAWAQRSTVLDVAGECAQIDVGGKGTGSIEITGTWAGEITWYVSLTGGTRLAIDLATPAAPGTAVNSATANGGWSGNVGGWKALIACMTTYTSGAATVTLGSSDSGGGGSGGSATASLTNQEADDASIAAASTHDSVAALTMAFDGTVWRRLTFGTAGTASAQVLTVQGIASMTPVLVTAQAGDNDIGNVDLELAGTAVGQTNPVSVRLSNGTDYLTPSTDATFGTTTYTETTSTGPLVGGIRNDALAALAGTDNEAAPLQFDAIGALWTRMLDPCSGVAKVSVPIDIVTATTTEVVGTASGVGNSVYICSITLVTAAANNVALVEDDTDACATPTAGLAGGVTAAEGWNFAANGGISAVGGNAFVAKTAGTNVFVCLITSAATQLSGTIVYAIAP